MRTKTRNTIITGGSLLALALGLLAGIFLRIQGETPPTVALFDLLGKIWVNLLILLVIPLVLSFLINTVLTMFGTHVLGKLGAYALLVHTGILVAGLVFSVTTGFLTLEALGDSLPTLSVEETPTVVSAEGQAQQGTVEKLTGQSLQLLRWLGRGVLVLMLIAVVFAVIVAKAFPRFGQGLRALTGRTAENSMRLMTHFLLSLPFAVFALALPMAAKNGFSAIGVAGIYVVLVCVLLVIFLALLYLAVHFWGFVSPGRFARAMIPAQVFAFSTRSSMATMPALMETAEHRLDVPRALTAAIIPFFVTLFRSNRVVSAPFNFLFLAYVYQLPLDALTFGLFVGAQIILSFGTLGIPSGGKYVNMPIYLAAGIPLEGYILLKAVDAIPDIFKTVVNVTEVMVVTTIVANHPKWTSVAARINKDESVRPAA